MTDAQIIVGSHVRIYRGYRVWHMGDAYKTAGAVGIVEQIEPRQNGHSFNVRFTPALEGEYAPLTDAWFKREHLRLTEEGTKE